MDPNECLNDALRNASRIIDHDGEDVSNDEMHELALELATSVLALHDWIRGGGFLPSEWRAK